MPFTKLKLCAITLLIVVVAACKKDTAPVEPVAPIAPVTPVKIVDLDRPINVKATKGTWGTKVVISWTPMPLAKKYQVYKFDDVAQQYQLFKELADTTVDDLISKPLIKSYYKVKVYNSATEYSTFSDVDYGYTSGKTYNKFLSFGSQGTNSGQFSFAMHVEVDKDDNIYVSDEGNNRVQKFDAAGNFKEVFSTGSMARAVAFFNNGNAVVTQIVQNDVTKLIKIMNPQKQTLFEWGNYGRTDGLFGNIEEIAIDDDQNIYVVDGINNYIRKYDQSGKLLLTFSGPGTRADQSEYNYGITYFKSKLYVSSPRSSVVRIFDKSGKYIKSWDAGSVSYAIKGKGDYLYIACAGYVVKTDENGEVKEKIGLGELSEIIPGLAVNSKDEVIVSDVYSRKIIVFKKL